MVDPGLQTPPRLRPLSSRQPRTPKPGPLAPPEYSSTLGRSDIEQQFGSRQMRQDCAIPLEPADNHDDPRLQSLNGRSVTSEPLTSAHRITRDDCIMSDTVEMQREEVSSGMADPQHQAEMEGQIELTPTNNTRYPSNDSPKRSRKFTSDGSGNDDNDQSFKPADSPSSNTRYFGNISTEASPTMTDEGAENDASDDSRSPEPAYLAASEADDEAETDDDDDDDNAFSDLADSTVPEDESEVSDDEELPYYGWRPGNDYWKYLFSLIVMRQGASPVKWNLLRIWYSISSLKPILLGICILLLLLLIRPRTPQRDETLATSLPAQLNATYTHEHDDLSTSLDSYARELDTFQDSLDDGEEVVRLRRRWEGLRVAVWRCEEELGDDPATSVLCLRRNVRMQMVGLLPRIVVRRAWGVGLGSGDAKEVVVRRELMW